MLQNWTFDMRKDYKYNNAPESARHVASAVRKPSVQTFASYRCKSYPRHWYIAKQCSRNLDALCAETLPCGVAGELHHPRSCANHNGKRGET